MIVEIESYDRESRKSRVVELLANLEESGDDAERAGMHCDTSTAAFVRSIRDDRNLAN